MLGRRGDRLGHRVLALRRAAPRRLRLVGAGVVQPAALAQRRRPLGLLAGALLEAIGATFEAPLTQRRPHRRLGSCRGRHAPRRRDLPRREHHRRGRGRRRRRSQHRGRGRRRGRSRRSQHRGRGRRRRRSRRRRHHGLLRGRGHSRRDHPRVGQRRGEARRAEPSRQQQPRRDQQPPRRRQPAPRTGLEQPTHAPHQDRPRLAGHRADEQLVAASALEPARHLGQAARQVQAVADVAHRPVVAQLLRGLLHAAPGHAVERLDEQRRLDHRRQHQPRRIAADHVGQLVGQHRLLLTRVEVERPRRHHDLAAGQRDRRAQHRRLGQPQLRPRQARAAHQRVQALAQRPVGQRLAPAQHPAQPARQPQQAPERQHHPGEEQPGEHLPRPARRLRRRRRHRSRPREAVRDDMNPGTGRPATVAARPGEHHEPRRALVDGHHDARLQRVALGLQRVALGLRRVPLGLRRVPLRLRRAPLRLRRVPGQLRLRAPREALRVLMRRLDRLDHRLHRLRPRLDRLRPHLDRLRPRLDLRRPLVAARRAPDVQRQRPQQRPRRPRLPAHRRDRRLILAGDRHLPEPRAHPEPRLQRRREQPADQRQLPQQAAGQAVERAPAREGPHGADQQRAVDEVRRQPGDHRERDLRDECCLSHGRTPPCRANARPTSASPAPGRRRPRRACPPGG